MLVEAMMLTISGVSKLCKKKKKKKNCKKEMEVIESSDFV